MQWGAPWLCLGPSGDAELLVSVTSGYLWSPCRPKQGQLIPVGAAQPQWCCTGSTSSMLLAFEKKGEHPLGAKQSLRLIFCV